MTARRRPGPKPKMVQGRDYYCGTCADHLVIACPECVVGCLLCGQRGEVPCPTCLGGKVPQSPPHWGLRQA